MTKSASNTSVPAFRSGKASRRFLRNLVWVLVIGGLFLGGQGLRYMFRFTQLSQIRSEIKSLYISALGQDIGNSPFGRLQFEHGKLLASKRIGLDPLRLLAALSRPADENLRLEGVTLSGKTGRVRGVFSGSEQEFKAYMETLTNDDHYLFSIYKRDPMENGSVFILHVELQ
ncbi:hypothetical protein GO013_11085 [Pseudodesulfovibrio sp. JC047]|uniref:hypothetical protein n=1 Tax=Pseudodesulfovibrio sp. JC047 TaxID=2683199 RepID=UPI0013D1E96F|nr:hypothetical protein [Pseudodesulfovibrio sp. JC047]NDV19965.1 hypothetical protein [Pseudodesulfovibrio sp. JC047]